MSIPPWLWILLAFAGVVAVFLLCFYIDGRRSDKYWRWRFEQAEIAARIIQADRDRRSKK